MYLFSVETWRDPDQQQGTFQQELIPKPRRSNRKGGEGGGFCFDLPIRAAWLSSAIYRDRSWKLDEIWMRQSKHPVKHFNFSPQEQQAKKRETKGEKKGTNDVNGSSRVSVLSQKKEEKKGKIKLKSDLATVSLSFYLVAKRSLLCVCVTVSKQLSCLSAIGKVETKCYYATYCEHKLLIVSLHKPSEPPLRGKEQTCW